MKQRSLSDQVQDELLDEIEQLRTSLETALEENSRLVEDRDRLRVRIGELGREVQLANSALARQQVEARGEATAASVRNNETEEDLRVAFEELQVLTEELGVANSSLQQANQELDARVNERTRQLQDINALLRSSEASFHTFADLVPDLLWRADQTGEAAWFNKRWFDFTGQDVDEPLGLGWLKAVHPLDRGLTRGAWGLAIAGAKPYEHQHRIRAADGSHRWFLVRAEPLRDDDGGVVHWFVAGTDINDQRVALEALEQSELRFRTLIEGIPQLVWRAVDSGKWTWSSPQWRDYTGQSEDESLATGWLRAFHPDDRDNVQSAWTRANETGTLEFEGRVLHAREGRYRHFRSRAVAVRGDTGSIIEWLGTSTDIDDLVQLQQQQKVLVQELQHRTRNLMAVVHAITTRTIKQSPDLNTFKTGIDDRLRALGRAQGLLSRRDGGLRVAFDTLLREELAAHVSLDDHGNSEQVSTCGPQGIGLQSATVQTLALALHELTTNAIKYGALSESGGHLHIEWDIEPMDENRRLLRVHWRESGVKMPDTNHPPRDGGYGRELIERALPYQLGAQTSFALKADGAHCTIAMAVPCDEIPEEKYHG